MATPDTQTPSFNTFTDIGLTNIWSDPQLADATRPDGIAPTVPRSRQLRDQRLSEPLTSCREQVLQQIIGPFGLTPALAAQQLALQTTKQWAEDKVRRLRVSTWAIALCAAAGIGVAYVFR